MKKGINVVATFGSSHLENFNVEPMGVMLYINGATENMLRAVLNEAPFKNGYCTTYPASQAKDMIEKYQYKLYSLNELMDTYRNK